MMCIVWLVIYYALPVIFGSGKKPNTSFLSVVIYII